MSGPYGAKEEIKMKTDMIALMSEYVRVKKSGASWMAVCPFHNEKSPSLHITPEKGLWYCHGCGEGGDIFGFVMRIEGLDFPETMKLLAKKAGVTVTEFESKESAERRLTHKLNGAAAQFYNDVLKKHPSAQAARSYVAKRGIPEATQDEFMIGYAPDAWDALLKTITEKGATPEQMQRAGLVSKSDKGRGWFDRFRARLMFPITDHNGEVVGFTARVMPGPDGKDPKDEAKYINTPQTIAYNKSHVLYGLHLAKHDIKKKNLAVIVEGNMDVVASHQAGIKHVVASSGTSFTVEQLQLLKRFTDRLVLSFDADAAGENAVRRSIDSAVQQGFSVRILRLPPGAKDPDDCVKKDPALWEKAIADAVPYMAWYLGIARERTDMSDPTAISAAADAVIKEIAKIGSPVERSFWTRETAQLFDTPESAILEAVNRARPRPISVIPAQAGSKSSGQYRHQQPPHTPTNTAPRPLQAPNAKMDRYAMISRHVVAAAIMWPDVAQAVIQHLAPEDIEERSRPLYSAFLLFYTARESGAEPPDFARYLDTRDAGATSAESAAIALLAEQEFGQLDAAARRGTFVRLIGELKLLRKARRQKELKTAMAHAELSGDTESIERITREIGELNV